MANKLKTKPQTASGSLQTQTPAVTPSQVVFNHVMVVFVLSVILLFVPAIPFTSCMHSYSGRLVWSMSAVFAFLLIGEFLNDLSLPGGLKVNLDKLREQLGSGFIFKIPWFLVTILVYALCFLLVMYLGSYRTSPWQIDEAPVVLEQFSIITSPGSQPITIPPESSIDIARGNFSYVSAVVTPPTTRCRWTSLNGGTLQTASQCSTYYSPPLGGDSDLLDVKLMSACQTKQSINHLKILILK